MMVVYEVNLRVAAAIAPEFERWLVGHIKEMLAIPGFFRARWYTRDGADEGATGGDDEVLWTVQYDVYTRDDLDRYLREDAGRMRDDGVARFGGRFSASRRVLAPRSLEAMR